MLHASRYGVVDYLVKPIHDEELHMVLERICGAKAVQSAEANQRFGFSLGEGCFEALEFKVDRQLQAPPNEAQQQVILKKATQIIHDAYAGAVLACVVVRGPQLFLTILLHYTPEAEAGLRAIRRELLPLLTNYLNEYNDFTGSFGYAAPVRDLHRVGDALEQARSAVAERIMQGQGRRQPPGSAYYAVAQQMIDAFWASLPNAEKSAAEEATSWKEAVQQAHALPALVDYLCGIMAHALQRARQWHQDVDRRPIREATQYIDRHYHQRIVLEDVAALSGFNATYFSELFKRETGKCFSDYLLEARMDAAKVLLRDTKEPIYTVAEKVGYKDAKYFSQQFTRYTGIKPMAYRKLYY